MKAKEPEQPSVVSTSLFMINTFNEVLAMVFSGFAPHLGTQILRSRGVQRLYPHACRQHTCFQGLQDDVALLPEQEQHSYVFHHIFRTNAHAHYNSFLPVTVKQLGQGKRSAVGIYFAKVHSRNDHCFIQTLYRHDSAIALLKSPEFDSPNLNAKLKT